MLATPSLSVRGLLSRRQFRPRISPQVSGAAILPRATPLSVRAWFSGRLQTLKARNETARARRPTMPVVPPGNSKRW